MKYLSLLMEGEVHPAPGKKVIPADQFATLMSAQELLQKIEDEAELYRKKVAAEMEEQRKQEMQRGFDAGMAKWSEQIAHLEKKLDEKLREMETSVGQVALVATRKIVGKALEVDKSLVVDIIANALRPVVHHTVIQIFVNKVDLEAVEAGKPRLKTLFDRLKSLTVAARDDVQPGGCIIETEAGIINAQLDQLWKSLEVAFQALST